MKLHCFLGLGGDAGIAQTVGVMRGAIVDSARHPQVKALAAGIVQGYDPRDRAGIARAIREYTRDRFDFVSDTVGTEELYAPHIHVDRIRRTGRTFGDCDDLSMLQAALLHAVGIPAKLATSGVGPLAARTNSFNHVFALAAYGGRLHSMDWLPIAQRKPFRVRIWEI